MKEDTIRTSIDLPRDLHRKLHEAAARRGTSARKLILESIVEALEQAPKAHRPRRRLSLEGEPLVSSRGKPFAYTNEELYGWIEFP